MTVKEKNNTTVNTRVREVGSIKNSRLNDWPPYRQSAMGKLLWWRILNGDCLSIYSFLGIFCLFFSPTPLKAAIARSTVQWSRAEWNGVGFERGRWIMTQYDRHPSLQWMRLFILGSAVPLAQSVHAKVSSEEIWQDSWIWFLIHL